MLRTQEVAYRPCARICTDMYSHHPIVCICIGLAGLEAPYDVVLAADCIYSMETIEPFLQSLRCVGLGLQRRTAFTPALKPRFLLYLCVQSGDGCSQCSVCGQ